MKDGGGGVRGKGFVRSAPGGRSRQVVAELVARGIAESKWLVEGDIAVLGRWRRNHNYIVARPDGSGFFVKSSGSPTGAWSTFHEYAVYAHLDEAGLSGHVVPHVLADPGDPPLLPIELLPECRSLIEHVLRARRFSKVIASNAGRALALAHNSGSLDHDPLPSPWALALHRPGLPQYSRFSPAAQAATEVLQSDAELCDQLDRLGEQWTHTTLIHADLKWDNVLVLPDRRGRWRNIRIIDWELASNGDPMWDVGGFLAGYLDTWVQSIRNPRANDFAEVAASASFPLEAMQGAIGSFVNGYLRAHGAFIPISLERAIRMSAARLLQSVIEGSRNALQLNEQSALQIQLASNLIKRPSEAANSLLGLPK